MKTIIAGSRDILDYSLVEKVVKASGFDITEVISGTARGVDQLGEQWAKNNHLTIIKCPADWNQYGKRAGHIRNGQMAEIADAAICIWDGESRGTKNMIDQARKRNLKVFVYLITPDANLLTFI